MPLPLSVDQAVPLDELHPAALACETDLEGMFLPGVGCFCLLLACLDLVANIAGVPWVTGAILENWQLAPTGVALWLLVIGQMVLLLAGLVCLYHSPWRRWLSSAIDELHQSARDRDAFTAGSPAARVGRIWDRLVQTDPPSTFTRPTHDAIASTWSVRIAVLVAIAIALLNLLDPSGWPLLLVFPLGMMSRQLTGLAKLLGRRLLADRSSMTGALLAVTIGLSLLFLLTIPQGLVTEFVELAWRDADHRQFRAVELFLGACLLSWLWLLPGSNLNNDLLIHVTEPRSRTRVCYDLSSFLAFRGRRVIAHLSPTDLHEVIVLVRDANGGYLSISPTQPLELNRQAHVVLYLAALSDLSSRKGLSEIRLVDRRGYFDPRADLVASPRPFDDADVPTVFPPQALDRLLGLLASQGLAGELTRLAQDAVDQFVESLHGLGEEFDASVNRLEGRVDDIAWHVHSGVEVRGELVSLRNAEVVTGLTELQQKQTALDHVQQCRADGEALLQRWLSLSESWREATGRVSFIFAEMFQQRYVGAEPLAHRLMRHCGIELRLRIKPAKGHIGHRAQLLERINQRLSQVRDGVLQEIARTQQQLFAMLTGQLGLRDSREQLMLRSLFTVLPEVLPWFRNRPDELLKLLEFAVRHAHEPTQAGNLLLQLSQQARRTGSSV